MSRCATPIPARYRGLAAIMAVGLALGAMAAPMPIRATPPLESPSGLDTAVDSPWLIPPPVRAGTKGPNGRSARQLNLERARSIRWRLRACKRQLRRRAAELEPPAQGRLADELERSSPGCPAGARGERTPPVPAPCHPPAVRGLLLVGLFGLALLGPSTTPALAQGLADMPGPDLSSYPSFGSELVAFSSPGALAAQFSDLSTEALAAFEQLGPACASPMVVALGLPACAPGYQAGMLEQMQALHAQAATLFASRSQVAGACRPGDSAA